MTPPPAYCGTENCRFSLRHAPHELFLPPAWAPSLPVVRAFGRDAVLGYAHHAKHAGSLTGADVMELLRLAWTATIHTVLYGRDPGDLYWVLDDAMFHAYFGSRRLKAVSQTCSDQAERFELCCAGCTTQDRPSEPTLRSVQLGSWIDPRSRLWTSRLAGAALDRYLTGVHEGLIGQRFLIEDAPAPEPSRERRSRHRERGQWYVPIVLEGDLTTVRTLPSRREWSLIDADEAAFLHAHDVIAAPDNHGGIRWRFVPRG